MPREKLTASVEFKGLTAEERLFNIIELFGVTKEKIDQLTKENEPLNKEIKALMTDLSETSFDAGNFKATLQSRQSQSFNEDMLLNILNKDYPKTCEEMGIIFLKPTIDYDKLESAIYHEQIDAALLAPAQVVKETVALIVKRKKEDK